MASADPPIHILLVDDHPANLFALEALLRCADYALETADSGRAALALMCEQEYAVVLLDVMMPEIDGFEVAQRMRQTGKNQATPVIFVTAAARQSFDISKGYAVGGADYLVKPLHDQEVRAKVKIFADLFKARRDLAKINCQIERLAEQKAKELAASDERFRLFIEGVREYALIQTDASGIFITWNGGAERLLGYSAAEIIGLPFSAIFTEEDVAASVPAQELAVAQASGQADDTRWHRRKDGSRFWARGITTALWDEAQTLRGFAKVLRDDTEKKQAEDAIKGSEAQLRLITNAIPALVCYVDPHHRYSFANASYEEWLGLTAEQVRGKHVSEVLGASIYQQLQPHLDLALAGEESAFEADFLPASERPQRQVAGSYTPDVRANGQIVGAVGMIADVTVQKTNERAMRANEQLLRLAVDATNLGIWDVDLRHGPRMWSERCREIFDIAADVTPSYELFLAKVHPDDRSQVDTAFRQAAAGANGGKYDEVYRIVWGSPAAERWIRATGQLVLGDDGRPLRVTGTVLDITETKNAELFLAEQAEVLDLTSDAIFIRDMAGRIIYWNRGAEVIYGWTKAEATGRVAHELLQTLFPQPLAEIESILTANGRWEGELLHRHRGGQSLTVHSRWALKCLRNGQPVKILETNTNVTLRRRVEEALRESERRFRATVASSAVQFRTLANSIPQLAWMARPDGWIYWYNERWYEYTGTRLEDMEGWGWQSVHDPRELPKVMAGWQASLASGAPFEMTFPLRGADGVYRPFLTRMMALKDEQGQVQQWFGTNTDITDLEQAQKAGALLAAIVAFSDDAIISKTLQGMVTSWNTGAERLFGYTAAEAVGQPITILIPPERLGEEAWILGAIERGERLQHFETLRLHKSGTPVAVSLSISPIRDGSGKIIGIAKIARDITEQQRSAEELRQAKNAAEAANAAKSLFLANMSHEIRTPLGAILGFTDFLVEDPNLSAEERHEYAATIRRNGHLLAQLIDDILDLSKVEAGKLTIERIPCSLVDILDDVQLLLGKGARDKGLSFHVHTDGLIPEAMTCDPVRLKQILINLIGNAIKFTQEGSVDITVFMRKADGSEPDALVFHIADTGRGLTLDQTKRLFRPFAQADETTTREFGGTGLGLVLARRLARALGGDVTLLRSDFGVGSVFAVTIDPGALIGPLVAYREPKRAKTRPSPLAQRDARLRGLRLLVAEDAPDGRLLIKRILSGEGATVEVVQDGREAVEKAMHGDFDAVLMDIQMPVLDGLSATDHLRRLGYTKPIIALTAHALEQQRLEAMQAGCSAHVSKPIRRDILVKTLADLIPTKEL